MDLDVAISAVTGVFASLAGVYLGGRVTDRTQSRHWRRQRLTDACVALSEAAAEQQIYYRHRYRNQTDEPAWAAWNKSMMVIELTAGIAIVDAAHKIDEAFWAAGEPIKKGVATTEADWRATRELLEAARLHFINVARAELQGSDAAPLTRLVARPVHRQRIESVDESGHS